jgi:hypothetical protein
MVTGSSGSLQRGGLTPPPPPPSPDFGHSLATPCRGFVLTPTLPTTINSTVSHFSGHCTGAGCRRQPAVLEPSALRPTSPQHTLSRVAQSAMHTAPPPPSLSTLPLDLSTKLHKSQLTCCKATTDMLHNHSVKMPRMSSSLNRNILRHNRKQQKQCT